MKISEQEAVELVQDFKVSHPDAYSRWFLLEAMHLGIDDVGVELNEFLWSRLGKSSEALIDGMMAMRGVIYPQATAFLSSVLGEIAEHQWRDVQRFIEVVAAKRAESGQFRIT